MHPIDGQGRPGSIRGSKLMRNGLPSHTHCGLLTMLRRLSSSSSSSESRAARKLELPIAFAVPIDAIGGRMDKPPLPLREPLLNEASSETVSS